MPLFMIVNTDKPNSLDVRMSVRSAHLEFLGGQTNVVYGGPLTDDADQMAGSLLVVDCETKAEAAAFAAADPYAKAGLFESVDIRGFRHVLPLKPA